MLNRIGYRLKDGSLSLIPAGTLLIIFSDYKTYGIYFISAGIVFYLFFNWLYKKTMPNQTFDVDKNGNIKKEYR